MSPQPPADPNNPPTPEPTPAPTPTPSPAPADPPDWARELKQTIESLPAKLKASITDDDKSSIAETVHGLFERSGAFEQHAPPPEGGEEGEGGEQNPPTNTPPPPSEETKPTKGGRLSKFASWFEGG